ncbi:MAG: efflux RND transporter permease subunit [Gemmatimonadales bacterium]|nr:MAG: efflux RND transporter permease subunit [Gemmatimonadales bacterium]
MSPGEGEPTHTGRPGPQGLLLLLLGALSERRVAMGAIAGATVILAVVALSQMPLQLLPEIRYPQIRVISDIPGQTSRVIEESVNEPIEAALEGTPGIVQMESRSGDGRSYIDLFFAPGYDLDRALRDATQAVQRALPQMPAGFPEPRIFAVSTMEDPVLQFAFGSSTLPVAEIRQRLRGSVLPRLRAVEGVEAVYIGREEDPELAVDVDPVRQAAAGISLDAVEAVLFQATAPPPSSAMRTPSFEGIVVLGEMGWDPRWLETQPIPVSGTPHAVPLGSFASVYRTASEERLHTRLNQEPAVLVSVHRSPNAHSLRMARDARAVVEELGSSSVLSGIEGSVLFDDSVVTRSAVWSVVTAAVGGALLAMLLLFFTLRHPRNTPLVAMVVGVSMASTVVVLFAMGQTLNLLTLAGLLLSVGLGLDYAIIYFDRLDRLERTPSGDRPEGMDAPSAPLHLLAMVQVVGPLLGALLTTLAAVLPFLLVQGMVALLFRPLIWTVVIAAIFSFLFAVILLPAFSRGSGSGERVEVEPGRVRRRGFSGPGEELPGWWTRLQRPSVIWGTVAVAGLGLFLGGRALPFEVLPVVDDGFVEARLTHPAGIPTQEMDALARRAEAALAELRGTDALFTTVGGYFREGLPAYRPGTTDFMVRVNTREGGGSSQDWAERARSALGALDIPSLRVSVTPPRIRGVQTRLSEADLIVVLTREDGNLLALNELESRIVEVMQGVPGLLDVQRERAGVSPRWMATPRYDLLAASGVSPEALSQTVAYALEGRVIRQRMMNGEPLILRTRYDRRKAGGPHHLESSRVAVPGVGDVQLGDLVDFRLIEEPTHIERREGQRVVRISSQFDPAGPGPGAVARSVERALAEAELPVGVSWWLEGELDALQETSRTFAISLGLALVMVLTLLLIQYGSLPFALAGLITIPLSGVGTLLLLAALGRPLDAMVLAGLLIAVGIVANNVILVLSQGQEATQGPQGIPLREALFEAARDRLRPISLTVFSTVLGMSPLLLGGAQVFGLLQPLAIALTGALLVSIPLACLLLPGVAASLAEWERRFKAQPPFS